VKADPYLRTDQDTDTVLGDSEAQSAADQDGLLIRKDAETLEVPLWAWITGIVVAFLILVALIGIVMWCIRRRKFSSGMVRSSLLSADSVWWRFVDCFVNTQNVSAKSQLATLNRVHIVPEARVYMVARTWAVD
jgi:hypothetical protein